ncbi:MAG TPA: glycosyltransferase 87 family protein [Gaiellaceae bacterium]
MTGRRYATVAAVLGAVLFLGCCLAVRGGLLDSTQYGDVSYDGNYGHLMSQGQWPYRDFFDEYPPLAQPLFLAVELMPGHFAPAFKWTMAVFGMGAIGLLVATLASVGVSRPRIAVAALTAGIAPIVIGPISLNTYDLFPALLTAGAILAYVRRRERLAYALLALGVAAKIYPVVLLPIALIESWERGGRELVRRGIIWFLGVLFLVHLPFAIAGPGGLRFSYWVQFKRGLEAESLGGAILLLLDRVGLRTAALRDEAPGSRDVVGTLATAVGALSDVVLVLAVLLVAWLYLRRRRSGLVAAAAAITAFVAFNKVFSPQYAYWLVPIVPAAGYLASGLLLVVLLLTHGVWDHFLIGHHTREEWGRSLAWWVFSRDLVVVALFGLLVGRLALRSREGSRSQTGR